jgi:signal transduction histidine kinase
MQKVRPEAAMNDGRGPADQRVLVVPPTTRDGVVTHALLTGVGLSPVICRNLQSVCDELRTGAAALLLTSEALFSQDVTQLLSYLQDQPSWSDLPIVLLMQSGQPSANLDSLLPALGNVTLLERPAATRSVVSAIQTAVRGRQRQYQIRHHITANVRAADEALKLQRRLLESERHARAEAERVSHMKDEFLATLSHELRTPLSAIFGWAQLLRMDRPSAETIQEGIEVIDRNVRLQTQLIEDLLDTSRIISGKIRLDIQQVELPELIDNAIESIRPAADAKSLRVERVIDPLAGRVSGDPGRLQQVIWNLLTNAIKFTPQGGKIQVVLERAESHVELSVIDSGQGIEAEFLPYLFERFSQGDASTTRKHGGLGLGLSIVKTLVELHGGTIGARSDGSGKGSTFVIQLPLRASKSVQHDAAQRHADKLPQVLDRHDRLRGLKILVVDDEPDARDIVERFLIECGAKTALASSAADAHRVLNNFAADVIVSDIGMPEQDGYELIRARRMSGDKTPAVALTAFARAEDRIRSIEAGFQRHLSKPVEPAELIAVVASLAGRF